KDRAALPVATGADPRSVFAGYFIIAILGPDPKTHSRDPSDRRGKHRKSLTAGPKSFQDGLASPFWNRLLIAKDRKSSNVIVFTEAGDTEKLIRHLERIVHELDERDFRIHIAGTPYVVEMLRRSLVHDFRYFSLTAVVLF